VYTKHFSFVTFVDLVIIIDILPLYAIDLDVKNLF